MPKYNNKKEDNIIEDNFPDNNIQIRRSTSHSILHNGEDKKPSRSSSKLGEKKKTSRSSSKLGGKKTRKSNKKIHKKTHKKNATTTRS